MINEKKKIMKANLKINEFHISPRFNKISDNLNIFFFFLINHISDNLWLHCLNIILQYLYLIFFGLSENVSLIIK